MRRSPFLRVVITVLIASSILSTSSINADDKCNRLMSLATRVSELRQLPLLKEINCIAADEQTFAQLKEQQLLRFISEDRLKGEELAFKMLGLIPRDYAYSDCASESSSAYTQAFYDVYNQTIVVPKDRESPDDILAHELVHALQDQHFNFRKLTAKAFERTDSALALGGVAEGAARLVQKSFVRKRHEKQTPEGDEVSQKSPCTSPTTIEDIDLFPYTFGSLFVERLHASGGLTALDQAFRAPPVATTQLIHHDNYPLFKPGFAKLRDASTIERNGSMFKLRYSDTLGQYVIRVLLGQHLDAQKAILASKGWRGDSLGVYVGRKSDEVRVVWQTEWTDEKEAREFYEALITFLSRAHKLSLNSTSQQLNVSTFDGQQFSLSVKGHAVNLEIGDSYSCPQFANRNSSSYH